MPEYHEDCPVCGGLETVVACFDDQTDGETEEVECSHCERSVTVTWHFEISVVVGTKALRGPA